MRPVINIVTVVGARPQFIKAAAVSRAIAEKNRQAGVEILKEVLVHTGQHYDTNMSQVFFDEMEIPRPGYHLEVGSGSHGEQTGKILEKLEKVLIEEKPDYCLVYGDTNSTLAGALAAAKLHIPVAHVESGLRSYYRQMPEEVNRVLTDHVSDVLFCPTETAVHNLEKEGIGRRVYLVGDVMYDCTLFYSERADRLAGQIFSDWKLRSKGYYLATIHRAENTDDPARLSEIFSGLGSIAAPDCPVVLPLHPRTVSRLRQYGLTCSESIRIVEPVSYLNMIVLEKNAKVILTDSGGIQKEAMFLNVPCVTLRDQTEWIETVECGWNRLVGADRQKIAEAVGHEPPSSASPAQRFYGNGKASEKIADRLVQELDAIARERR